MDIIVDLPISKVFNIILVIVDRFTKRTIFIPTTMNLSVHTIADNLFNHGQVRRGFLHIKFIIDQDTYLIKGF